MNKQAEYRSFLVHLFLLGSLGFIIGFVKTSSIFDFRGRATGGGLEAYTTPKDRFFGIGGDLGRAKLLGIGSFYDWARPVGLGADDPEAFYTVGKLDDGGIRCANNDRFNCTMKYLANGDPDHPTWSEIDDIIMNKGKIGMVWAIANEPDWYPYVPAYEYVTWYYAFSTKIRSLDPTAKIMVGGLHTANPNEVLHLGREDSYRDASGKIVGWAGKWRDEYKKKYGGYPTVDIWNVHEYPDDNKQQAYDYGIFASALEQSKQNIMYFRSILQSFGEGNKPLWVSEFGILMSQVSGSRDDDHYRTYWNDYMQPLIEWMRKEKVVQRIFPFWVTGRTTSMLPHCVCTIREMDDRDPTSVEDLNLYGRELANYIVLHQDTTPPKISALTIDTINRTVQFSVSDDEGTEKSGVTAYEVTYSNSAEKSGERWYRTYTLATSIVYDYGKDPHSSGFAYLMVHSVDAAGNSSKASVGALLNVPTSATPTPTPTSTPIPSPTPTPTPAPTSTTTWQYRKTFSSVQGGNNTFYYAYRKSDASYIQLSWDRATNAWKDAGIDDGNFKITGGGMSPSRKANSVIRWIAPEVRSVSITGFFQRCCTEVGVSNNTPYAIYSVRKNGRVIWKQDTTSNVRYDYSINARMDAGDRLEFWIDSNDDSGWDWTTIDYTILKKTVRR